MNLLKNIFLGLGSNKGDRLSYIQTAINIIDDNDDCFVEKVSSVYETKPFGDTEQEKFLNIVMKISSVLDLKSLFLFIKSTEKKAGRTQSRRWGPREIDIDLLYYGDLIYSDDLISVPHKGITERDFVSVPLAEIAPDFIHPALKKKNIDICKEIPESYIIRKFPGELIIKKV
ncbi:MAG: 2-amino-4-hydroxy-6-hydroxymethyldihydropteridine diphosphokinase [Ignavibacteriales bacterium]|nr:MAG: 2-amino-4-hydroxy-6-hydroxymethyldihydropteridine diphosphokinase [Ignavibacteriales bacterium]